jgi:hypothetical protein
VIDSLAVASHGNPIERPAPVLLTRKINLRFTLEDELATEVVALRGRLRGVYPSVYLYSRTFKPISSDSIAVSAMTFDGVRNGGESDDGSSDAGFEAGLSLFGICNPGYGVVYDNLLTVWLTLTDGYEQEIGVWLTNTLSDWFVRHDENNMENISLRITVFRDERIQARPTGVTEWEDSGNTGVVIRPK